MEKIFIGGPIKIKNLDNNIASRLDNIIRNKYEILIGDANGVDKLIQEYLSNKKYKNVTVYCVSKPRNNLDDWPIKIIPVERKDIGFEAYIKKDFEMAKDSTMAYMIWNGKSNGTLNNIVNMLEQNKKTLMYYTQNKEFFNINKTQVLKNILALCNNEDISKIDKKINIYKRLSTIEQNNLMF